MRKLGFVLKVMATATALAALIKWKAPLLQITPNTTLSLTIVLTPTAMVGAVLAWRAWRRP